MSRPYIARGIDKWKIAKSRVINIDNGAAATIDEVLLCVPRPIEIKTARIVYDVEACGTVAGASAKIGTAVGGAQIVAAANLTNSAAVGDVQDLGLVLKTIAANLPVIFRHTGIAATAAGQYHIEIEWCYA